MMGIWEEFLTIVKNEAGSRVVDTWFKAVSLHQWDSVHKTVYLKTPNQFVRDWIHTNYLSLIQFHLGRLLHVETPKILLLVNDKIEQNTAEQKISVTTSIIPAKQCAPVVYPMVAKSGINVTRSYSFDNFVVGPSNSLAHAAAHAVAQKPGRLYNPLFLYGKSGLGKTHLLHSIGNEIKAQNNKAVILYQATDRFVTEFINAIRFDKMHKFQAKYKEVDVLLIDDIQFLSNKEQTQEAFFHIFNALYESHKQIVFSSDTFPQNIAGLAERLRSRLAWGLVADIYMPSLETKIAIVKKKAEMSDEPIDDEVAHFIASREVLNIRELEGAFVRVMAFASLTKQNVTLDLAKKVLQRIDSQPISSDFERIVRCITKYYSYDIAELRSKSRNKDLSLARQITMFLMKKVTDKSLRDIGEFLGGRDHSTVMHAINKVEEQAHQVTEFKERLHRMEQEIIQ